MSNDTIKRALSRMGYKQGAPGLWIKPVGFSLFSYEFDCIEWTQWIKGIDGNIYRYATDKYDAKEDGTPLEWLKHVEAWKANLTVVGDSSSAFEMGIDPELLLSEEESS